MLLADTSAWVWTRAIGGTLREAFDEDVVEGQIATCDMVRLELLYSARNHDEFIGLRADLDALPDCPIGSEQWSRALEVYEQLSNQGGLHHRAVRHRTYSSRRRPKQQALQCCTTTRTTTA